MHGHFFMLQIVEPHQYLLPEKFVMALALDLVISLFDNADTFYYYFVVL